MQAEIFELFKSILKARRMTYAILAERLGISEPTVKRIFADRDCKLSRITAICDALDLSLNDLLAEAHRFEVTPVPLEDKIEAQLAADRPAFHLFLLLLDEMTPEAIKTHYALDDTALFALGLRLERLGLVEMLPGNRMRLLVKGPVQFRRNGPLHKTLLKLNMDFVQSTFLEADTPQSAFLTQSRRVSEKTALHIMGRLNELRIELSDLARRDQLTKPEEALKTYKLSLVWSPVAFPELLKLSPD